MNAERVTSKIRQVGSASALVAVLLSVSACGVAPGDAPTIAPPVAASPAPNASTDPGTPNDPMVPSASWECGHASALSSMLTRAEHALSIGEIDEEGFNARLAAVKDAWSVFPLGSTEVSAQLRSVMQAAAGGGVGDEAFDAAFQQVAQSCLSAGSSIIEFGPGG